MITHRGEEQRMCLGSWLFWAGLALNIALSVWQIRRSLQFLHVEQALHAAWERQRQAHDTR